jgi:RNA polymerase sigma factor (sigma-70 family)
VDRKKAQIENKKGIFNRSRVKLKVIDPGEKDKFQNILNTHLEFIERQCNKVIRLQWRNYFSPDREIVFENEVLELFNCVCDTIQARDFRVLKEFRGNSKLTTYLTSIISRQAVDQLRRKKGRTRDKERANAFGETGVRTYELIFKNGLSIDDAFHELQSDSYFDGTLQEFYQMVEKIRGRERIPSEYNHIREGFESIETGDLVAKDSRNNPEELAIKNQDEKKLKQVINDVISTLKGEERMILRMRYPIKEGEEPMGIEQISLFLGISKKAIYNRLERILKKCKKSIKGKGININDFF